MLCKYIRNTKIWSIIIAIGIVTLVFGIVYSKRRPEDLHSMNMLMGMLTGIGGVFTVVGTVRLIHYKRTPDDKLKKEEIERKDERNIQLSRIASTIANNTASALFIVMIFILVWLDYRIPAFIVLGAFYLQSMSFFIAYRYFNNKM